jgi:hypothetical protein
VLIQSLAVVSNRRRLFLVCALPLAAILGVAAQLGDWNLA